MVGGCKWWQVLRATDTECGSRQPPRCAGVVVLHDDTDIELIAAITQRRVERLGNGSASPAPCNSHAMIDERRLPLPPIETEAALATCVLDKLGTWCVVHEELQGTHWSGRRFRLDAALVPKDPEPWKDDRPAFGVEFKIADERSVDTRRFTAWAAQAVNYTETDWDGFGRLKIFGCPSPIRRIAESGYGAQAAGLMAQLLGQFGVDEFAPMQHDG
mgnify:CR=1 FL=1